jgi:hypothetical protein
MGKGEVALEAILLWGMKKVSSGDGDTLRRSALNRARSWGCGRVMSCSGDQEQWRTELELSSSKSFDDRHRSATLGAKLKGVRFLSGRGFLFDLRWLTYGSLSLQPVDLLAPLVGADRASTQPTGTFTSGLSTVWSPVPPPDITTETTGQFSLAGLSPLERQVASLQPLIEPDRRSPGAEFLPIVYRPMKSLKCSQLPSLAKVGGVETEPAGPEHMGFSA